MLGFVDGISKDRVVGFEGLGRGNDSFNTKQLEARLLQAGVLSRPRLVAEDGAPRSGRNVHKRDGEDDGDDYDEWE